MKYLLKGHAHASLNRHKSSSPKKDRLAFGPTVSSIFAFLVGACFTNLAWLSSMHFRHPTDQSTTPAFGNGGSGGGILHALEEFAYPQQQQQQQRSTLSSRKPFQYPVPIVIICSMRPDYLRRVLDSLSLEQQHPSTPAWIAKSTRYIFIHRHSRNDKGTVHQDVLSLAQQYNYTVHEFNGLYHPKLQMNINANFVWYRLMSFLFQDLEVPEAFMVEDDTVLAHDGLLMAARLLQEKHSRTDIHAVTLGGWSGENMIHPDPYTYVAIRQRYFQPMAYSMDRNFFQSLLEKKKERVMQVPGDLGIADWCEETTDAELVKDLTMLSPSLSRMHHIGKLGMGGYGDGDTNTATRQVTKVGSWHYWDKDLRNPNTTIDDFHLEPKEIADRFGFVCDPPAPLCSHYHYRQWIKSGIFNAPNNATVRYPQSIHNIPADAVLGPRIPVVEALSSPHRPEEPPSNAIDNNIKTVWYSPVQSWSKMKPWIEVRFEKKVNISSVTIMWDRGYASHYEIQLEDRLVEVKDGQGGTEFWSFDENDMPTSDHVKIECKRPVESLWGEGITIREIIVRGETPGSNKASVRNKI
jgi:F5/8 type C domain